MSAIPEVASMARSTKKKAAPRKRASTQNASNVRPNTVTPYLAVGNAAGAIDWYKKAFGAKELSRQLEPTGKVMHAAVKIGGSVVFLSDIFPGSDMKDPLENGTAVNLHIYSPDIDKIWKKAVANGAKVSMPLEDQFWGERFGKLADPYGHSWGFSWRAKMSAAEMEKKREEAMKQMAAGEHPGRDESVGQPQ